MRSSEAGARHRRGGTCAHLPRDVWIAAAVAGGSAAGDMAAQAALVLRLHGDAGTGAAVSALLLANSLPVVLCAPVAGRLADRVESRVLLVGCGTTCAALCLGLIAVAGYWPVLCLLAAVAAVSAVSAAALGALLPAMSGEAGVVRANALVRGALMVGGIAGLALGGAGSEWLGTGAVLVGDAATFGALAVGALLITARRGGAAGRGCVRGEPPPSPTLLSWVLTGSYAGVLLLVSTTNVAQVFLVKDVLGQGDLGFGVVCACWTAGILLALPVMRQVAPDPTVLARLTVAGQLTVGAAIAGCGAVPSVGATATLYILGGIGTCVMQVARGSFLHLTAPPERRGRALARYNAVVKGAGIAALVLGGVALDALGARSTYLLAGLGSVAVAVVAWTVCARLVLPVPVGRHALRAPAWSAP